MSDGWVDNLWGGASDFFSNMFGGGSDASSGLQGLSYGSNVGADTSSILGNDLKLGSDFGSNLGLGGNTKPSDPSRDFSWGSILGNSNVLGTAITGLTSLYGNYQNQQTANDALALKAKQDEFEFLSGLAKLKYLGAGGKGGGGKGGGGGSLRNRNADLVEVISNGTDQKLKALNSFANNYIAAVKG